jgi:putative membrane protein
VPRNQKKVNAMQNQGKGKDIATIVVVIALVILLFGLMGGGMMMWPGMMGWAGWGGFGFSPIWGVVMMVFWVLIVGGAVALVVWLLQQGRTSQADVSRSSVGGRALDILQERYAKGEITKEQFEQIRRDIEGK